jgi:hypothetical protein
MLPLHLATENKFKLSHGETHKIRLQAVQLRGLHAPASPRVAVAGIEI